MSIPNSVLVDQVGSETDGCAEFCFCLPLGDCRFALFDDRKVDEATGSEVSKLYFVNW